MVLTQVLTCTCRHKILRFGVGLMSCDLFFHPHWLKSLELWTSLCILQCTFGIAAMVCWCWGSPSVHNIYYVYSPQGAHVHKIMLLALNASKCMGSTTRSSYSVMYDLSPLLTAGASCWKCYRHSVVCKWIYGIHYRFLCNLMKLYCNMFPTGKSHHPPQMAHLESAALSLQMDIRMASNSLQPRLGVWLVSELLTPYAVYTPSWVSYMFTTYCPGGISSSLFKQKMTLLVSTASDIWEQVFRVLIIEGKYIHWDVLFSIHAWCTIHHVMQVYNVICMTVHSVKTSLIGMECCWCQCGHTMRQTCRASDHTHVQLHVPRTVHIC